LFLLRDCAWALGPFLAITLALSGCGDDGMTMTDSGMPDADSGMPDADSGMPPIDSGMDSGVVGAPFVAASRPEEGDEGVPVDTRVLLLFSEEMDVTAGTVSVEPGGLTLDASTGLWIGDEELMIENDPLRENVAVVLDFPAPLVGGVEYTLTANTDFRDVDGLELDDAFTFLFVTIDEQQPTIVSCTPAEGATGLSAIGITEISCTFDEEMNTAIGSARLVGGPGRLGDPVWDIDTITWPVTEGLAYDSDYSLVFSDFFDRVGNDLDGAAYIGDGRLDFSTGTDGDAPTLVASTPAEGMRGVNPALPQIVLEWSEPMDTSVNSIELRDGTTTTALSGTWSADGMTLALPTAGVLAFRTTYTLDVAGAGLVDLEGNPLDASVYLVDGLLDFVVEDDAFGPRVIDAVPGEGAVDIDFAIPTLTVRFDEAMDTSVDTVDVMDSSGAAITVAGNWAPSGQIIDYDVRDVLMAGESYSLDFRGYSDVTGNGLDATDVYLGDGVLDFETVAPSGDSCAEALTVTEASTVDATSVEWLIAGGEYNDEGATDICDGDGSASDDLVIEYVKTSGDLASGGRLLHVFVESNTTSDINLELRQGSCDPEDGEEPILGCQETLERGGITRDVGPGTYYIWLAKETSGAFPGATVRVEELDAWPVGESCNAPFDMGTSAGMTYLPPVRAGDPHIYQIRPSQIATYDRGLMSNGPGEISCSTHHGADAVVRFDKAAGSVLDIRAIPVNIRSSSADLNMEISLGCDPADSSYTGLSCDSNFDRRTRTQVTGPAGPVYIWLSSDDRDNVFPGATVEITEITVGPGESCGTARPITGPTAPTILDSTASLGASGCLDVDDEITWFAYTPAEDIAIVSADAGGTLLLADQETNLPLSCQSDATRATPALIRAGRTVCIGISNGSDITALNLGEQAYTGVRGVVTDTGLSRPLDEGGFEMSWMDDFWLTVNDSTLYFGVNGSTYSGPGPNVYFGPKAGGTRLVAAPGITSSHMGDVGIAIGDELFGLDDNYSGTVSRVHRLHDGAAFPWSPEAWDTPPNWNDDSIAMTYDGTSLLVADHDGYGSPTDYYAFDPAAPGPSTILGSNSVVESVVGIAADATYLYIAGLINYDYPEPDIEGIFRLARADLGDSAVMPELLAQVDISTYQGLPMFVDDDTTATVLYFRRHGVYNQPNQVHAILSPASATPLHIGPILSLGHYQDYAMTLDRSTNSLFLFESETDPDGRIVRVD